MIADPLRRTCQEVALARLVAASCLSLSFLRKIVSSVKAGAGRTKKPGK